MADTQRKIMSLTAAREHFCSYMDERILLSIVMGDIDSFYTLEAKLTRNDFLSPEHATLYSILRYMLHDLEVKAFDKPKILDCAKDNQALDALGGAKYLEALYDMPVDPRNMDVHVKKVLDSSSKYKLFQSLAYTNDLLCEDTKKVSANELITSLETDLLDMVVGAGAEDPKDLAEGLVEFLEERKNNPIIQTGLDTGFPILNKQIDGLTPGALHVIAARKKMGKSAVLSAIARYVAYHLKVPVLYIDTELSFNEWRTRQIAGLTKVKERTIKHGSWTDEEEIKISKGLQIVGDGLLFHEYMPGYTVDKIIALYKKYKAKYGIGLAIFDYIKEPDSKSIDASRKEYQILGDVATKLKDLAGQLDIPVLTAVQLNRQSDIADSDRIARYADVIAFWEQREQEVLQREAEESGEKGGNGGFRLVIKDTRRGGSTPPEGITYYFTKEMLSIREVPSFKQPIDYTKGEVNYGSSSDTGDIGSADDEDELS